MMDSPVARERSKSKHEQNISDRLMQSIRVLDNSVVANSEHLLSKSKSSGVGRPYIPRYVKQDPFDVSSYFGSPIVNDSSINMTKSYGISFPEEKKHIFGDSNIVAVVEEDSYLENADPGVSVASGLFAEYLDAYQGNQGGNKMFDLVISYMQLCQDKLTKLKSLICRLPSTQTKCQQAISIKCALQSEINTWELIRILYEDRLLVENSIDACAVPMDTYEKHMSEKQFVDLMYERDSLLRQSQLVVNWLELAASKEMQDSKYDRFEFFSGKGFYWENTMNILKQKKLGNTVIFDERSLVTELDPDAPSRQHKLLANLDKENELSFLKCLFLHIRCGQMEEAESLCRHNGQMWRAAVLHGWRLFHDPNYEKLGPDGKAQDIEGNCFRDIWKSACWNVSEEESCNLYERAIYALLCGNLKAILPVCNSWEEYLWAYFRVMIDVRVELELRCNLAHNWEELPVCYWNQKFSPETIFQELKASTNEVVQHSCNDSFHVIQKYIILDDMGGLIEEMYEQIKQNKNPDHHFIRFGAHLVLFLRTIGRTTKEELCVAILEEYVKVLVGLRQIRLVPAYTATLPQLQQIAWYAYFLEDIQDREERQLCLQLAEEAGLDVHVITKTVVEKICSRRQEPLMDSEDLQSIITDEDQKKIDSIDWLVFDSMQRAEAMRQANTLMRHFIGSHKLDAARAVFTKIPPDSIDIIMKRWQVNDLPAAYENATREYLCLQAYLQAQDAFSDWFEHFHHGKPECPQLPPGASFTERVSYEHKETQYKADVDRWRHTLDLQTKVTVGKMYNVLLFVNGGWMADQRTEDAPDKDRALQMERLRELCLPQITLLLHSVLHSTGKYKDALQLADVITSENHQLHKVFRKQELYRLLFKLRESSLHLLDQSLDPMGYSLK